MVGRILLAGFLCASLGGIAGVASGAGGSGKEGTPKAGTILVRMETSLGPVKLELFPDKAPKTVANFLKYVKDGFYDGTIFHRIVAGPTIYVIQAGGYSEDLKPKAAPYPPIPLESQSGLKNVRGTISMGRTSQPNSATCHFFINTRDNPSLDYPKPDGNGYAVFGRVVEGMEIVEKLGAVETTTQGSLENVPVTPAVIKSMKAAS